MIGRRGRLTSDHGSKTIEELNLEVAALQVEERRFRQEHRNIRDQAHKVIDSRRGEAQLTLDARLDAHGEAIVGYPLLSSIPGDQLSLEYLHGLHRFVTDEPFWARLHDAIDKADGYSPLTQSEFDEKMASFQADARDRRAEIQFREVEQRRAEVERELAGLEARGV